MTFRNLDMDNVRVYAKPYGADFARKLVRATPETNRRATIELPATLDCSKTDCGIQAAIDALPPTGGAVILPKGEFILRQAIILREGVTLRGQGRDTRLALPAPLVHTVLTAPAKAGDTALTVADASGFMPGSMLAFSSYYFKPEDFWTVTAVTGNTLEINKPLAADRAEKSRVANFFPIIFAGSTADVEVRDLDIIGRVDDPLDISGGYGVSALTLFHARNARVVNVHVDGWKGDALSVQAGRDVLVVDCVIRKAGNIGYHPGSLQQRMILSRCRADECGDAGFFFCRYNKYSVMNNNTYVGNRHMITGLAGAGDMYNTANRNYGRDNRDIGFEFCGGANNVVVDNLIIGSRSPDALFLTGGIYRGDPRWDHVYNGPTRYHVIVGNTVVAADGAGEGPIVTVHPGAAANVIADNRFSGQEWILDNSGGVNRIVANQAFAGTPARPANPPAPPPLPEPVVVVAALDETQPDLGLQKQLETMAARGGTLRLPAGEYRLAAPLTLPAGVTLCGEGLSTRLLWSGTGPALTSTGTANIGIRRLRILGAPGTAGRGGIALNAVTGATLESVDVERMAGTGITVSGGAAVKILQSRFRECGTGIELNQTGHVTVAESAILDSRSDGIVIAEPAAAIELDTSIVWFQHGAGVRVRKATDSRLTIHHSMIAFSGENGIRLTDCVGATVRGNVVVHSSLSGHGAHAGLLLDGATRDTVVEANRIGTGMLEPPQVTAVEERDAADANRVRHNVLTPVYPLVQDELRERVILKRGAQSVFDANVLEPYMGPAN